MAFIYRRPTDQKNKPTVKILSAVSPMSSGDILLNGDSLDGERHPPRLIQAMRAEGLREHYPLCRHLIGSRVAGYVDGSTEMLLERVASFVN